MSETAKDEFDPFERAISVLNQVHRWLGGAFEAGRVPGMVEEADWHPATDVYETPEGMVVCMEVAGVEPSCIELGFRQGELTVSGHREVGCTGGRCHLAEIENGRFFRRITVPAEVDGENVRATFRHGLLEVWLPRQKSPAARKITISDESEESG